MAEPESRLGTGQKTRRAVSRSWWLGLAVVPLALYGLYIAAQFEEINVFNQGQLSRAGEALQEAIGLAVKSVQNVASKDGALCRLPLDEPYLAGDESCKAEDRVASATLARGGDGLVVQVKLDKSAETRRLTVQLQKLLDEMPFPDSFQTVFLADEKGHLIFHMPAGDRAWEKHARRGERVFRQAHRSPAPVHIRDLKNALADMKPGFEQVSAATNRLSVNLGGQGWQLFLEPLNIDSQEYILGGLVSTTETLQRAMAVDTYLLDLLVILLLVGACGYPFVKLWALDRQERLRMRDVYFLYLSSAGLLALATFVILTAHGYGRLQKAESAALDSLAASMSGKLEAELRNGLTQLQEYDKAFAAQGGCAQAGDDQTELWAQQGSSRPKLTAPDAAKLVQFEQIAWVGPDGVQRWKVVTGPGPVGRYPVGHRQYFQAPHAGNVWKLRNGAGLPEFFVHATRSFTDGQFYTFLAIRSQCKAAGAVQGDPSYIAVMTMDLGSLGPQPLPPGYGFAVFDREGTVQYHSDPRLSFNENLLQDLAPPERLRSVIASGRAMHIDTAYRTLPYQFAVQPLDHVFAAADTGRSPWVLATFRDLSMDRAVVSHVFLLALLMPWPLVLLITGLLMWTASTISGRLHGRNNVWLWPHEGRLEIYRRSTLAMAALAAAAWICVWYSGDGSRLLYVAPLAAAAVLIVYWRRDPPKKGAVRRPMESLWWHRVFTLLVSFCMVVAPAAAVFCAIWDHETAKYAMAGRERIARTAPDILAAVRAELVREENQPVAVQEKVETARAGYLAAAPSPFAASGANGCGRHWTLFLADWVTGMLPIQSEAGVSLRFRETEACPPDPIRATGSPRLPLALAFAALAAVLLGWIRWNAEHIFLARAADGAEPADPQAAWPELSNEEKWTLLQAAGEGVANPRQREVVERLLGKGLLQLRPDLVPVNDQFADFLAGKSREHAADLEAWEQVEAGHSWRRMSSVFWLVLALVFGFLLATQPSLPTKVLGLVPLVTKLLNSLGEMMTQFRKWLIKEPAQAPKS